MEVLNLFKLAVSHCISLTLLNIASFNKNRQRERLHHSLPALDMENLPDIRHKHQPQKKKNGRQSEDETMTFIISAFYAKMLVIVGFGFSITRSITRRGSLQHDMYFIYLYSGSIIFLLYMYTIHLRTKSLIYEMNNGIYRNTNELLTNYKRNIYTRYGSFYFRMGVVGFGTGSFIFAVLQFGQYFEFSGSEPGCPTFLRAVKPVARLSFILLQMLFIFSFSNFLDVQRSQLISKFGLMHMVATNVSDWFHILIEATVRDIFFSAISKYNQFHHSNASEFFIVEDKYRILQITRYHLEQRRNCSKFTLVTPILNRVEPHLASCAVEYNLLCTIILILMWKNSTLHKDKEASRDLSTEISRQSDSNLIYGRSQSQFSVDCAQTQRGLFSGILLLAVTIINLIMFFEFIAYDDKREVALLQVNTWEAILFLTATVALLLSMVALRDIQVSKNNGELKLEHIVLLITQYGLFMYFLFQIIGGCMMGIQTGIGGIMRITTPCLGLIQSCCQTTFILDAWRRRCLTEEQMRNKPGRQLITFLLMINVSFWVVNRVKNNRSAFHPNQMDFYGILAWNIITHVSMPLIVSYRFQATVCFYEIWKHVYKSPFKANISADQKV